MKNNQESLLKNVSLNDRELRAKMADMRRRYCSRCGAQMRYMALGDFHCPRCGNEEQDDYGKIRTFLDENGPSPSTIIQSATGVSREVIDDFLRRGKLEVSDGSAHFLKCEECGCDIKYGRVCPACAKKGVSKIKGFLKEEVGEEPTPIAKMRFVKRH